MALTALGLLCLFLLARLLTPDPRSIGTHEQVGLPPCATLVLFHIPCPFCGMTTAFSLMAHGRITEAFLAQPAGAIAALACLAAFLLASVFALSGWWLPSLVRGAPPRILTYASVALLLVAWIYKILTFR